MPNLNDFYDFNNTNGENDEGGGGGGGCFPWKTFLILAIIYVILTLIGRC